MTTNTPKTGFDLSGFHLSANDAQNIRRSAEVARAAYLGIVVKQASKRIGNINRSIGDLFTYTQRLNQAARL